MKCFSLFAGLGVLVVSSAAQAHVDLSIGLGMPVYSPPVYVAPAYAPPVYMPAPAVVYPRWDGYREEDEDGEREWRGRWREHDDDDRREHERHWHDD